MRTITYIDLTDNFNDKVFGLNNMPKRKQITLADIAEALNVSKVTISKALRNHPDIGEAMKQKVRNTAEKLGYVPNFMARNLSSQRSQTIGLVVPKIAHHFFAATIEAIYETAYEHNYEVILTVSQESAANEKKHIQTLLSMRVDGLLVSTSEQTKDTAVFKTANKRGVPLVFFDRAPDNSEFSMVTSDDEGGSYQAVRRMIRVGYTNIAHLAGYRHTNIGAKRRAGYERAMQEGGAALKPELIIEGGFSETDGYYGFFKLFKQAPLPQAIFAVTYPVALGILLAADEIGIKIPDDLDLLCFGGSEYNRFIKPPLSFVDQPTEVLGKTAVELLLSEIMNPEQKPKNITIPTRLVICETCKKC